MMGKRQGELFKHSSRSFLASQPLQSLLCDLVLLSWLVGSLAGWRCIMLVAGICRIFYNVPFLQMRVVLCMQESLPTPQKYQHSWCSVCCFRKKKSVLLLKKWCKIYSAKSSPHGHCQRETAARASLTGVDRFMTRNRRPRSKSNYFFKENPSPIIRIIPAPIHVLFFKKAIHVLW